MGTPRRIHVDSTSILRRYVEGQISKNFCVISRYFFNVISMVQKSTSFSRTFFWCNFDGRKMHVVTTYFFRYNFDVQKVRVVSAHFFRCNFSGQKIHVVSSKNSSLTFLFPLTFFDVILMVEKSTLFTRIFADEFWMGKNSTSFLVKLQANENICRGFPLLVTLKK